jgi:hypothetical protein
MFLYFASHLMHATWEAPSNFIERCAAVNPNATSDQQTYCAMNLLLDETVGNLTCALEANGMANNTLFVLASDNGGVGEMTGSNHPYRGYKFTTFRGGNSVPGFVYGSEGLIPKERRGSTYAGQMHVTDWLPTLMGLATNGTWSGSMVGHSIDGADMWESLMTDGDTAHPEIVLFLDRLGSFTVVRDMVKMTLYNGTEAVSMSSYESPDAKFVAEKAEASVCLFASASSSGSSAMDILSSNISVINLQRLEDGSNSYLMTVVVVVALLFSLVIMSWHVVSSPAASDKQSRLQDLTSNSRDYACCVVTTTGDNQGDEYFQAEESSPLLARDLKNKW